MQKILVGLGLLVLVFIIVLISGRLSLQQRIIREVDEMFAGDANAAETLTMNDIIDLPEPVQRWLIWSGVIGRPIANTIRLKQTGEFRMGPDKPWVTFTAQEYFTTAKPAFLWSTRMRMAPWLDLCGRDRFYDGHGHMLIKLLSLIPVADETGDEIDQATLLRFLNEIMWFPSAAMLDYIDWEPRTENSARATIAFANVTASADFYFDELGRLRNMIANRYRYVDGAYQLDEWQTPITAYAEFDGLNLASAGEGIWKLSTGDFVYIKLRVTDIDYNVPQIYK